MPNLPPVPGASGKGHTVVNTEALATFRTVVNAMIDPVSQARAKVATVSVAPGAFFEADQIRTTINGAQGTTHQQHVALGALGNALTAMRDGLDAMIRKYTSTEELNNAKANDVNLDLALAEGYFGQLVPGGGGGSGSGSGSGTGTGSGG